jgi:acyl carrier protein
MNNQDVLNLIADALELEPNSLKENQKLEDLTEFDSMSKLSIIVLADDEFQKRLTGEQLREFITVGDIVNFLQQ